MEIRRIIFLCVACLIAGALGGFWCLFEKDWADFSSLNWCSHAQPSIILDEEGNEFARFALDRRKTIEYNKLPKVLIHAFLATEDVAFFKHQGISVKGLIRCVLKGIRNRKIVGGASTITQQLARGLFLSNRQTVWRKIREAFLSFQIERHFTKEQIFELYVNNIYFGRGVYGVEAACQRFWNKSATDISLNEAATLAAVAKSAYLYSPLNDIERSKRRRNTVLWCMNRQGFISKYVYEEARKKDQVVCDYIPGNAIRLYIQERIRQWAERRWGKEALYREGLRIETTINSEKQRIAEELFCKKVEALREKVGDNLNGGMLSIESHSGKIKVCVGGYNFRESQFNRAFQAVRQMGSTFKPIVYTAALLDGIELDTVMKDEPVEMSLPGCKQVWRPKNWTRTFDGSMTLARALSRSNNIITIKTLLKTGLDKTVNLAKHFGLHRALAPYPSIALGTAEATVSESVAMFNVFVNNGVYVAPYLIERVKDRWGKKLWEHEHEQRKVLDTKTNSKMVNALSLQLKRNKKIIGSKDWVQSEVIGKTGSTNEAATMWYVGASPELTTSIYFGRDDNKPLGRNVFSSQSTYPVWFDFYKKLSFTKKRFYTDPTLREVHIHWVSGFKTDNVHGRDTVMLLKG